MLNFKNDVAEIGGWLTKAEGVFLYKTAKSIDSQNVIVEIGSWKGRSTICLGKGVQDGNKTKVYAIDPHVSSSKLQKIFNDGVDTYQGFIKNIKNADVNHFIEPIRKTSEEASRKFQDPIRFLFIDGSHEFKSINLDYKLWFPKVIDYGIIAFHDTWQFPGPHLITAGILLFSSKIKNPRLTDTITSFTKVKKNSFFDRIYNVMFFFYRLVVGVYGFLILKYKGSK